jgi:hypothetical protein
MKKFAIPMLAFAALGLTGCDDYVTPKGAVFSAAVAVRKNDVKAFRTAFTPAAKNVFGTKAGLEAVRAELAGVSNLTVEDAKLVKTTPVRNGAQVAVRTYTVGVDGKIKGMNAMSRIMTATVDCSIFMTTDPFCMDETVQSADCYFRSNMMELTECRLSNLK